MSLTPDDPRHGTPNCYTNLHCRCDTCKKAWADYHRDYMNRNEWQARLHASREISRYHAGRASHSRRGRK